MLDVRLVMDCRLGVRSCGVVNVFVFWKWSCVFRRRLCLWRRVVFSLREQGRRHQVFLHHWWQKWCGPVTALHLNCLVLHCIVFFVLYLYCIVTTLHLNTRRMKYLEYKSHLQTISFSQPKVNIWLSYLSSIGSMFPCSLMTNTTRSWNVKWFIIVASRHCSLHNYLIL